MHRRKGHRIAAAAERRDRVRAQCSLGGDERDKHLAHVARQAQVHLLGARARGGDANIRAHRQRVVVHLSEALLQVRAQRGRHADAGGERRSACSEAHLPLKRVCTAEIP